MEERRLTKADIDKVRNIEGFPIAKDEDIIALSRPPYYTACPNPFIEDFIKENGTPYDEATDDYHREPFAADVSEGKNDPIYNAHSYHTKVPYKAIMRYILHYTKPGDIIYDGFCGTGMTGVAAQMCGYPDPLFKDQIEMEMPSAVWGTRKAILNDLSPAASFISYNYNTSVDADLFDKEAQRILNECEAEYGWMYKTYHVDGYGNPIIGIDGMPVFGRINYTVWSDVFVCPSCSHEFAFTDVALVEKKVLDSFLCPACKAKLSKKDCSHAFESVYDDILQKTIQVIKQKPVIINYSVGKSKHEKKPDKYDIDIIQKVEDTEINHWVPSDRLPDGGETRRNDVIGITHIHHFYTRRNLLVLSSIMASVEKSTIRNHMRFLYEQIIMGMAKIARYAPTHFSQVNQYLSGTLYVGSQIVEVSPSYILDRKTNNLKKIYSKMKFQKGDTLIAVASTSNINIPSDSIDYIFTDPPFGANLNYSELNVLWESWMRVYTNNKTEAIVNPNQNKALAEYQTLMEECFLEYYRVLKPNHWITIEFHNSKNAVWNAIQEALQHVGFIVADVRTLDKQHGTFQQLTAAGAVQQDLVISAYKPLKAFIREFTSRAGDPEMAWEFVRQHLRNVPVTADGNHDGKLDIIAERQDYLLFDRMVAWHIMNGIPVPMDAHTFYEGLRQRFLVRDGMFFLPDQVNEYDDKRAHMELDVMQMELVPIDEKSSIAWLNMKLNQNPMTYQQIQPLYMQELHQSSQEKMPELLDMLKENFVQDEKGAWYVPDLTNAADLAKVRRKALLKEFWDSCAGGKGKLKVFRMEAIRAGFDECWKQRDYKTIVSVGERLPEAVLQEDPALLMYYDNACSRM